MGMVVPFPRAIWQMDVAYIVQSNQYCSVSAADCYQREKNVVVILLYGYEDVLILFGVVVACLWSIGLLDWMMRAGGQTEIKRRTLLQIRYQICDRLSYKVS
jgi:hypothetical protein